MGIEIEAGAAQPAHREILERALQFEFAGAPKDDGAEFSGRTLRIFGIGHALEDLAVRWLRGAGFDLYTRKGKQPALASPGKPRPPL